MSSFHLPSLIYAHQCAPDFPLVLNCESSLRVADAEELLNTQPYLYGLCLHKKTLDSNMVEMLRRHGKSIAVYTCNSDDEIRRALDLGVDRVILGTAALNDPDMVSRLSDRHGKERIMVALDIRRGIVTTEGWQRQIGKKAIDLGRLFEEKGAGSILFTNIDVEGQQKGIDLGPTRDLVRAVGIPVVAAGGVTEIEDVLALRDAGVAGAVAGTAIYTSKLSVRRTLEALR